MNNTKQDLLHLELLTHMLGAGPEIRRTSRGYRNRFCATIDSPHYVRMFAMVKEGLVVAGEVINDGRSQMFHATEAGCKAAGLSKAATKRALED